MKGFLLFTAGASFGSVFGVVLMCCLQINRLTGNDTMESYYDAQEKERKNQCETEPYKSSSV